jgi:hypothetical protein
MLFLAVQAVAVAVQGQILVVAAVRLVKVLLVVRVVLPVLLTQVAVVVELEQLVQQLRYLVILDMAALVALAFRLL